MSGKSRPPVVVGTGAHCNACGILCATDDPCPCCWRTAATDAIELLREAQPYVEWANGWRKPVEPAPYLLQRMRRITHTP